MFWKCSKLHLIIDANLWDSFKVSGTLQIGIRPVYATVYPYTGQVTVYKVPETHGHI